ncbi:uncharacterized protein LOC131021431 [Salvia miltiorrhiza]|uniref:uncharacterized protein LOC131021431 n=1 Tax=Salvia miltiorrhiza TaxID=226208 RepID=UPI0025AD2336|nr:uncharacterized protein LOC131021431 [Salvia miltiorrhiza]XP_057806602.1 uncharacterized protein LOC131021431 [Salvia miltiorrhiza]
MKHKDGLAEIDRLERGLLLDGGPDSEPAGHDEQIDGDEDELPPLYTASFGETEENFVKYQTTRWVLYSLLLILAWGIGLFMLIYLPLRRYILRIDIRSRKLYLTSDAIVYKVRRPVSFPCFGVLKKEKHVLLLSVADVAIEQGYLQSLFGVYSIRIENVGVRRPPSDDVQIQGVTDPHAFRKAVLSQLSTMRGEVFSRHVSTLDDNPTPCTGHSSVASMSPSKLRRDSFPHLAEVAILQKLEEVGSSVKRVQTLIEEQKLQASELAE